MLALILYLRYLDSKRVLKFYVSLCCSIFFMFHLNLFNNFKKCPECYGEELCPFFQSHQIELTWFSRFMSIINPNLTKSVFYGTFNGTDVVIKRKLGRVGSFEDLRLNSDRIQNVILCPSVRDLGFLFDHIEGVEDKRLWIDIKTSIEPLLLKYFKAQGNWPVPDYVGACGDLIIEEYKGESLANLHSSNFKRRVSLAIQLLKLANLFTFGHPRFAFYFTDYSLDNLVVDSKGEVYLVDLDNVIISNKSNDNRTIKGALHTSEVLNDNEYAFSPFDICSYYISDHNYFSVCKYLLTHADDGLLKDISKDNINEELFELLNECTIPDRLRDRFSAGWKLQLVLEQIIDDGS